MVSGELSRWPVLVLCILLIPDNNIVARPLTTESPDATFSLSSSSQPPDQPPTILPETDENPSTPGSLSSRSEPKTIHLTSSLLKNLLLQVMEDKEKISMETREAQNTTEKTNILTKGKNIITPKDDDKKMSTLTLVAIIALVIGIFIFGLFIAVLCPDKVSPKRLFKCCLHFPICTRHKIRDRGNQRRYHNDRHSCYHHGDANNSTATIINESISSCSATSNQNFNVNDNNNCCSCLKHTSSPESYPDFAICSNLQDFVNHPLGGAPFPHNTFHPNSYQPASNVQQQFNVVQEARSNEIRRDNSRSSTQSKQHRHPHDITYNINTKTHTINTLRRNNSRNSVHSNSNSCLNQQIDCLNVNNLESKIDQGNGFRKQNSRGSLHSREYRQNSDNVTSQARRPTPASTSGNISSINDINYPRSLSQFSNVESRAIYHTEAHSGGSHENANLNTMAAPPQSGDINQPGSVVRAEGLPESHSNGSRGSNRRNRRSSVVLMDSNGCSSCPYCDERDVGVHVERTWVDHENRQHSAL